MQLSRVVCWPKSVATLNACKMHIERAHVCIAYVSRSVKAQQCLIPWPTWTTESQIVVDISRRISGPGSAHLRLHFQEACAPQKDTMSLRRISRITEIKVYWSFEENVAGPHPTARLTAQHLARRSCRKKLFLVTFRGTQSAASSGGIAKCRSWFHGGSTRDWENDIRGRIKRQEENFAPVLNCISYFLKSYIPHSLKLLARCTFSLY